LLESSSPWRDVPQEPPVECLEREGTTLLSSFSA
jgi:hypothetical protein